MDVAAVAKAPEIYRKSIVWDCHSCMPIKANQDLSAVERHRQAKGS